MAESDAVIDSPTGWVAAHIRRYVNSDGENGAVWYGKPTLLLTTRGRRTGALRRTALIYGTDGDRIILVASNAGSDNHPNWYLNLRADPTVELQIKADKFTATARDATADERPSLWEMMAAILPQYNSYKKKAKREIPVVVLEPHRPDH
jgi:deazaflavin-dependent oxidoreductase (nitroreductase family)